MSVNILDVIAQIENDIPKVETDAKAALPLIEKAVSLLGTIVPLVDPQLTPVVTVTEKVLAVVSTVLAKLP